MDHTTMKIKTEIVKGVFIITFAGSRLDTSFARGFLDALQENCRKGCKDLILDLSHIDSVNSQEFGIMVSSLKEVGGSCRQALCGISGQVLDLLHKTHMDEMFIHSANREEALADLLAGKRKRSVGTIASTDGAILVEEDWLELLEDVSVEREGEQEQVESDGIHERRLYRRIECAQILDEDILVYCSNNRTGRQSTGILLNISPGGIFMISTSTHEVGDEFVVQGRVGASFKLKEQAVVRSCRNGRYGLEFINPSHETQSFLNQLIGAVSLQKESILRV